MATTLYARDTIESGVTIAGAATQLKLSPTIGASAVAASANTTASGNHIVFTDIASRVWLYRVNAVTISGAITVKLWGYEDAMATNCRGAIIISRYDSSGTFVSDVVAQGNANHPAATEWGTGPTPTSRTWTPTPTSTAFADGDWLGVWFHADAAGTMAAGSMTLWWDDTAANTADTLVTFTETITEYVPSARVPRSSPYPQLLAQ